MLKAYRVEVKTKDGGYKEPDQVSEGGSYDTYEYMLVNATSKRQAEEIAWQFHGAQPGIKTKVVRELGTVQL